MQAQWLALTRLPHQIWPLDQMQYVLGFPVCLDYMDYFCAVF